MTVFLQDPLWIDKTAATQLSRSFSVGDAQ